MDQALFDEHIEWVDAIARAVGRGLPPSFDPEDLVQIARIEHWHRVQAYDPLRNDSYRGYAYQWIKNAVRMACRRGKYRDATHERLGALRIDRTAGPEEILLAREKRRNVSGPRDWRERQWMQVGMAQLRAADAYLLRRVYLVSNVEGVTETRELHERRIRELAKVWGVEAKSMRKRVAGAVRRLRKEVR